MSTRAARVVAGTAVAVVTASMAAGAALGTAPVGAALFLPIAAFASVGALVVSVRSRSPIGWLFLAVAVLWATGTFASDYAVHVYSRGNGSGLATAAAWYAEWYWIVAISLIAVVNTFLFPTGRLPSPRWRPVFFVALLSLAVLTVLAALDAQLEPVDQLRIANPVGVSSFGDVEDGVLGVALVTAFAGFAVAATVSLLLRFRGSSGDQRQQLKWFTYACTLLVVGWLGLVVVESLVTLPGPDDLGFALLMSLPPLGAGTAILRHRLYDIDVVINRTLVYGVLTASLGLTYLGSVLLLQLLLQPLTEQSDFAVAGSTLAVAALFRPLRTRIQAVVDRRFYRRRYDATRTLEAFGTRLRDELDLDALSGELRGVVRETMQPAQVSLWLRDAAR